MKNLTSNKQITENELNKVVKILKEHNNTIDVQYSNGELGKRCIIIWVPSLTYSEIKELEKINLQIMFMLSAEHEFQLKNEKVKLECIMCTLMK